MIRPAVADDAESIAEIYAHEVLNTTATAEEEPPGAAEMAARMARIATLGLPWIVAEAAGAVAAYAYVRPYHERAAYRWTVEDSVYVAAHARGRGFGRALLAELIARASLLGKTQMIASISVQGGDASLALHAAMGFREAGRLPAIIRKFDRWLDVAYLQRAL